MSEKKLPKSKEYLKKTFLEELNHKIWCTKGARFYADQRFKKKSKLSNISLSFLSAYLIITSLISVYNINQNTNDNIISYLVTALSILLLVVSMYESNQDYKLRAHQYHNCGLELSEIYNKLRTFKTLKTKKTDIEIHDFSGRINSRYQEILNRYANHENIDFNTFRVNNLLYFGEELSDKEIKKIKKKLNWNIYGWYVSMIVIIPIVIVVLICV
ncbi:SLATT domain-containing protein [Aquimarina aquimarini]|uniref:SLATT domain-containing protein n=1 Tax=Aquimarina aquimarini TaxID=1191734 RepID=UPI000D555165|nr:SLATT domain-containing protein [Aquimarina aquimarini]